jgi:hypothetical protein
MYPHKPGRLSNAIFGRYPSMIRKITSMAVALAFCCAVALPARAGTLSTGVLGLFPRDIGEFAYADMRQARTQPWFPQLKQQMMPARFRQFEQLLSSAGIDPNAQVDEVAWALLPIMGAGANAVPTSENLVGVALGSFRPEVVDQYFQKQKLPAIKVDTLNLYAFSSATGPSDLFFTFFDSNTAVFGQRKQVEQLIDVRKGAAESLLRNPDLSPLVLAANGSATVWSVMNAAYTRLAMQQLAPETAQFPQAQQLTSKLKALTVKILVRTDVQAQFQAVCATPEDANTFAALLQAGLLYRRYQASNTQPEMAALLDQTSVSPAGDRLDLRITLTTAQLQALIARNTFSIGM